MILTLQILLTKFDYFTNMLSSYDWKMYLIVEKEVCELSEKE